MANTNKMYKIGELSATTGVSRQTIHYYLREGLLLPPVRTGKNMAYYDAATVEDIRFIKELQETRYFPLAAIKEVLHSRREGNDFDAEDHLLIMNDLFHQARNGKNEEYLNEAEFLINTDMTREELEQMIKIGLISPSAGNINRLFDRFDVSIGKALRKLLDLGFTLQDLKVYGDFLLWAHREATLTHDRIIHRSDGNKHFPLQEIRTALDQIKKLLVNKAYRKILTSTKE